MKSTLLILVLTSFFSGVFSQNLISYSTKYASVNYTIEGRIFGYKTHFSQGDSISVKFASVTDTISFKVKTYGIDDSFYIYNSQVSLPVGVFDLYVETLIDGWMMLPQAVCVKHYCIQTANEVRSNWRFSVDTTVDLTIHTNNTILYPGIYDSAYFVRPNQDTIFVDSISLLTSRLMKLYFHIPTDVHGGYYDLFVFNEPDTLLLTYNAIFISNNSLTQIDSISPDSIHNQNWMPWTIYVYGNKTHFTNDSNVIINGDFHITGSWGGVLDSVQVLNDTLLKFNISLPMSVKQAMNPNSTLYIYNTTDGLMSYPMVVLLYGSIGDQQNNYNHVKLYPNPAREQIWIESDEFAQDKLKVSVYSVSGAIVGDYEFSNKRRFQLPTQMLSNSVYFVYIQGVKKQEVLKFIKQ